MKRGGRVFPRLAGGLGNQMFQIAAAIGLADRLGCDWACPEEQSELYGQGRRADCYRQTIYRKLPFAPISKRVLIREYRTDYHWIRVPRLDADWQMSGYWQSPAYWASCADRVRAAFDLTWWNGAGALDQLRVQSGKPLCAVHYRGGDFLRSPGKHRVCGADYFRRACAALREDYHLLLFTDDLEAARGDGVPHDVHFAAGDDALEFAAMAHCDAGIISNSTFAWWAMFLGHPKREVHLPDRWFGPLGPADFQSIYLPEWVRHSTAPSTAPDSSCLRSTTRF